jgi:hypothetical protein
MRLLPLREADSSTLYRDYPLSMTTSPFLRIRWDVVPRASTFLDFLGTHTRIAEPISLMQDFTRLQYLSRDEQQTQLRDLAGRGQIVTAIYLAQKMYGGSLAEAKEMIEKLVAKPA